MSLTGKASHVFVTASALEQWRTTFEKWDMNGEWTARPGVLLATTMGHQLVVSDLGHPGPDSSLCHPAWQQGYLDASLTQRPFTQVGLWYPTGYDRVGHMAPSEQALQTYFRDMRQLARPLKLQGPHLVLVTGQRRTRHAGFNGAAQGAAVVGFGGSTRILGCRSFRMLPLLDGVFA